MTKKKIEFDFSSDGMTINKNIVIFHEETKQGKEVGTKYYRPLADVTNEMCEKYEMQITGAGYFTKEAKNVASLTRTITLIQNKEQMQDMYKEKLNAKMCTNGKEIYNVNGNIDNEKNIVFNAIYDNSNRLDMRFIGKKIKSRVSNLSIGAIPVRASGAPFLMSLDADELESENIIEPIFEFQGTWNYPNRIAKTEYDVMGGNFRLALAYRKI